MSPFPVLHLAEKFLHRCSHLIKMFIVAVCVSGNLYQLRIFIFFRCINGVFYRNCLICISMNQKHRLFIFADRLVYIQKLCCADIIAAQMPVSPFQQI